MAEFPNQRPNDDLGATSRVVPFARLDAELSPDVRRVTPEERAAQCADRAEAYRRRLPEASA